jgi:[ribosomal protein S18]-alanine N-acetyltransferase
MNVAYRAMTMADLDGVLAIETVAHEAPWTRGNFADSLAGGHLATIMLSGQSLLGYAVVMSLPDEAELLNITIAPASQKQGLGQQFLNKLCVEAKKSGAERMHLEVRSSNTTACALYARSGFSQIGARRGYYACKDGRREDALLMAKTL